MADAAPTRCTIDDFPDDHDAWNQLRSLLAKREMRKYVAMGCDFQFALGNDGLSIRMESLNYTSSGKPVEEIPYGLARDALARHDARVEAQAASALRGRGLFDAAFVAVDDPRRLHAELVLRAETDCTLDDFPAVSFGAASVSRLRYGSMSVVLSVRDDQGRARAATVPLSVLRGYLREARVPVAPSPPTLTPEVPMSTPPKPPSGFTQTVTQTLLTDAGDAAWRTAGSQFVKLARAPLVGLLARHLGPDDDALRGRIAAFLETELGTALLTALLSAMLTGAGTVLPGDVAPRMAQELRVRAMAEATDAVADVVMEPLRQVMQLYLAGAPPIAATSAAAPARLEASKPDPAGEAAVAAARKRARQPVAAE